MVTMHIWYIGPMEHSMETAGIIYVRLSFLQLEVSFSV